MRVSNAWLIFLVMTLALIWSMAILKMVWSPIEVEIWVLDNGDFFITDDEGRSLSDVRVVVDNRYWTVRSASILSWLVGIGLLTIWTYRESANKISEYAKEEVRKSLREAKI